MSKTKIKTVNDSVILTFVKRADCRIGEVMDRFDLTRSRAGLALKRLRKQKALRLVGKRRAAVWTASAPSKSKKVAAKKSKKK